MNTKAVINRTNNGQSVGTDKTGTLGLPYRIRQGVCRKDSDIKQWNIFVCIF